MTQTASVSAAGGVPDLIGVRIGYEHFFPVRASLGIGLFPINGLLNQYITLSPQPVNFSSTTDTFNLYPAAGYSLTSFGLDLRYHVASSGFFFDLVWSNLYFSATFNSSLKNENTGGTVNNAITGGASVIQPLIGLGLGYEISFTSGLVISFMGGASLPLATFSNVSLSGTAAQAAPLQTGGDTTFNNARTSFQASLDAAIAAYRAALPIIPMLTLQLGWVF